MKIIITTSLAYICLEIFSRNLAVNGLTITTEEQNFCEKEANTASPPRDSKDLWCFNRLMRFRNYWKRRLGSDGNWGYAPCSR